jgi:hypothetical protein
MVDVAIAALEKHQKRIEPLTIISAKTQDIKRNYEKLLLQNEKGAGRQQRGGSADKTPSTH